MVKQQKRQMSATGNKQIKHLMAAGLFLVGMVGFAIPADADPVSNNMVSESRPADQWAALQNLRSFEINHFHHIMDLEQQHVDAELIDYVGSALYLEKELPVASPADGMLHVDCQGYDCHRVLARVTVGEEGLQVWQKTFKNHWFVTRKKDQRRMAQEIITALKADYLGLSPDTLKASSTSSY